MLLWKNFLVFKSIITGRNNNCFAIVLFAHTSVVPRRPSSLRSCTVNSRPRMVDMQAYGWGHPQPLRVFLPLKFKSFTWTWWGVPCPTGLWGCACYYWTSRIFHASIGHRPSPDTRILLKIQSTKTYDPLKMISWEPLSYGKCFTPQIVGRSYDMKLCQNGYNRRL